MVTRRVSEDFYWFLANASGCQYPQLQKLIYLGSLPRRFGLEGKKNCLVDQHRQWLGIQTKYRLRSLFLKILKKSMLSMKGRGFRFRIEG